MLLRAGRVVEGVDLARVRRGPRVIDRGLARGPACLTQALGIGKEHNGADLTQPGPLAIAPPDDGSVGDRAVSTGPRVGVTLAPDVPVALLARRRRDGLRLQTLPPRLTPPSDQRTPAISGFATGSNRPSTRLRGRGAELGELSRTRAGAVPPRASREASEPSTVSTSRTPGREVR